MEYETLFKALASNRRRSILRYLKKHGEKSVSDISVVIGISDTSTSKHLVKLCGFGLVEIGKKERTSVFRLNESLGEFPRRIVGQI